MTTPLLLAFMLIQAPNAAPQSLQSVPLRFEPVLAAGIKVKVVEANTVEMYPEAMPISPVSAASFVGVTPEPRPCTWSHRRCESSPATWTGYYLFGLGWNGEYTAASQLQRAERYETLWNNPGLARGRAMAAEKARVAEQSARTQSGGRSQSSRSGSTSPRTGGSAGGGGSTSGAVSKGSAGGGSSTGSPVRGRKIE